MEPAERYRIVLDPIVTSSRPEAGDDGPRMFNLFIRDRVTGAILNAYLVGSKHSVQAVVGQIEFLQFARLTSGGDNVFLDLVQDELRKRGVDNIVPILSFVKEVKPLKPPPKI